MRDRTSLPVVIKGRGGLGDAFFARPFVRGVCGRHSDVYVDTSWPWVFSDLPVKPTKRQNGLKVQAFHGDLVPAETWHEPPDHYLSISLRYRWTYLRARSVIREMEETSGFQLGPRVAFGHPPLPGSPLAGAYAVVRPPAVRLDYPAPSREPDPAYLAKAALALRARGLRVVTVGHWLPGLEEPSGAVDADLRFENGELPLPDLCALVARASVIVAGPCWLLPFALAAHVPIVLIAGGCGLRNSQRGLVDRRVDSSQLRWLQPDDYCMCGARMHACPKEIKNFDQKLSVALNTLRRAVA